MRNGNAQRLYTESGNVQHVDGTKTGVFGGFIRRVLEHHGNGTGEYRQYTVRRRHRQAMAIPVAMLC